MISRYIENNVTTDLRDKMILINGPRQVGKTTCALQFLDEPNEKSPAYLNWDNVNSRKAILSGEIPPNERLIVFDEIHKYSRWRNLIKGLFDTHKSTVSFIVTGSARLDVYRRGGDSLQGRYFHYRLHPLSLSEISSNPVASDLDDLLHYGGFPEPFLKCSDDFRRRWSRQRVSRVLYDDVRDLENIKDISLLELLVDDLPRRIGAPLSIRNLRETLDVAHDTADRWITILERMYHCFRIAPFGAPQIRAVKKERKLYLIDWADIESPGARFENMVACQLLKYCHFIEDTKGHVMELRFLRDTDKREIDFVVIRDRKPQFAVECKTGEKNISPSIRYFLERTAIPLCYQVHLGKKDFLVKDAKIRVLPWIKFCSETGMP